MYELDKRKFGSFVSSLRKEKGWTQKELAQRLFVSDKAVSKWETGASIPDTALLIPLAGAAGRQRDGAAALRAAGQRY